MKLNFNNQKVGYYFFCLGIILLPSAPSIAGLFFLISIIISIIFSKNKFFADKWNFLLILSTFLIFISCIFNNFYNPTLNNIDKENYTIWLNIFNWIPFFVAFWSFQPYLDSNIKRGLFSKLLIIGSIPVFVSCILQKWFNVYGPLDTLNGLIIWYQKPLNGTNGVSGLFSNPNYTSFWLSVILPFSLSQLSLQKNLSIKYFLNLSLAIFIIYLTISTNSRSGLLSIFNSIYLVLGAKYIFYLLLLFALFIPFYILLIRFDIEFIKEILPLKLINKLTRFDILNFRNYSRINIYLDTIKLIAKNPIFGLGGGTFAIVFPFFSQIKGIQHAHNLPLQIAYDFGILTSITLTGFVFFLFTKSFKKVFIKYGDKSNIINKAWICSTLVCIAFNLTDIPYYDFRVSIVSWILLSGIRSILRENLNIKKSV